jgi:protein TonB
LLEEIPNQRNLDDGGAYKCIVSPRTKMTNPLRWPHLKLEQKNPKNSEHYTDPTIHTPTPNMRRAITAILLAISCIAVIGAEKKVQGPADIEAWFAGALEFSKVDKKPVSKQNAGPMYPSELKQKKIEGEAVVDLCIEPDGKVRVAVIKSATHPKFGEAALEAVKQWRFSPAIKDGKPVRVRTLAPFSFALAE